MVDQVFETAMTEDLSVSFVNAMPERVVNELAHLPGVTRAEGMRVVPVRFANGPRHRDSMIFGQPDDLTMRRLLDSDGNEVALPREGLLIEQHAGATSSASASATPCRCRSAKGSAAPTTSPSPR